jgi:hypothetical protein
MCQNFQPAHVLRPMAVFPASSGESVGVAEPDFVAGSAVGAVQAGPGFEATGSEKPLQFGSPASHGGRAGRGASVGGGSGLITGSCDRSGSVRPSSVGFQIVRASVVWRRHGRSIS